MAEKGKISSGGGEIGGNNHRSRGATGTPLEGGKETDGGEKKKEGKSS